jgi:hypothetical protein
MEGGMRLIIPVLKGGLWCMDKAGSLKQRFFPKG